MRQLIFPLRGGHEIVHNNMEVDAMTACLTAFIPQPHRLFLVGCSRRCFRSGSATSRTAWEGYYVVNIDVDFAGYSWVGPIIPFAHVPPRPMID